MAYYNIIIKWTKKKFILNKCTVWNKNDVLKDWQSLLENDKIAYVIILQYSIINKISVNINEFKNNCFKSTKIGNYKLKGCV